MNLFISLVNKIVTPNELLNILMLYWPLILLHLESFHFLDNATYRKYKTFRAKTFQLLNHVDEHIDKLKTLMVEKFQIVKAKA